MKSKYLLVLIVVVGLFLVWKFVLRNKHLIFAELRVQVIRNKVEKEANAIGSGHWAGSYYYGDGLGMNKFLDIAPNAGFAYERHGCLGLYDRNYGKVKLMGDNRLMLSFALSNDKVIRCENEFIVVKWGDRFYLIPPAEMKDFFESVNEGSEPRYGMHGRYFLRIGDETIDVEGKPDLVYDEWPLQGR